MHRIELGAAENVVDVEVVEVKDIVEDAIVVASRDEIVLKVELVVDSIEDVVRAVDDEDALLVAVTVTTAVEIAMGAEVTLFELYVSDNVLHDSY